MENHIYLPNIVEAKFVIFNIVANHIVLRNSCCYDWKIIFTCLMSDGVNAEV